MRRKKGRIEGHGSRKSGFITTARNKEIEQRRDGRRGTTERRAEGTTKQRRLDMYSPLLFLFFLLSSLYDIPPLSHRPPLSVSHFSLSLSLSLSFSLTPLLSLISSLTHPSPLSRVEHLIASCTTHFRLHLSSAKQQNPLSLLLARYARTRPRLLVRSH